MRGRAGSDRACLRLKALPLAREAAKLAAETLTASSLSAASLLSAAFLALPAAADAALPFFGGPAEGCTDTARFSGAASYPRAKRAGGSPCWKHPGPSWAGRRTWPERRRQRGELCKPASCPRRPPLQPTSSLPEAPPCLRTL